MLSSSPELHMNNAIDFQVPDKLQHQVKRGSCEQRTNWKCFSFNAFLHSGTFIFTVNPASKVLRKNRTFFLRCFWLQECSPQYAPHQDKPMLVLLQTCKEFNTKRNEGKQFVYSFL